MEFRDTMVDTSVDMQLLEISIDSGWNLYDFNVLIFHTNRIIQLIGNCEALLKNKQSLKLISKWCRLAFQKNDSSDVINALIDNAYTNFNSLQYSPITSFGENFEILNKSFSELKDFRELNERVILLFTKNIINAQVVKINYNSPGEIITQIPKTIAEQTNGILNTLLFYSQRKKQFEIENKLRQAELNTKTLEYDEKIRRDLLNSLSDELTHSIDVVNKLSQMKEALINCGIGENEATEFIKRLLLDKLNLLFPVLNKVTNIELLK